MQIFTRLLQVLRQRAVWTMCVVVFTADVVSGIVVPTFSLYAASLGASLALIGLLTSFNGLTSIVASVPIGLLSDLRGRKQVLAGGMLLFALSSAFYTMVPNPWLLIPVRVMGSLGMIAVFMVGVAYMGDVVAKEDRGLAVGLYSTAMGLGFTVGPAAGGLLAERYGYRAGFWLAAGVALVGFFVALWGLAPKQRQPAGSTPVTTVPMATRLRLMAQEPNLLAASLANLANNVVFTTVFSFVPLFAASLTIGQAAIGSMFAGRALASTVARLPTGLLTTRIPSKYLMISALALAGLTLMLVAQVDSPAALAVLMLVDGVAFGMYLTAGQSFITENAADLDRGTAMGVYNTAGSIGGTIGPFALGILAGVVGLAAVFRVTAVVALAGAVTLWLLSARGRNTATTPQESATADFSG
ncbi:MAG: MFS transporter [Caldilineaceae bacterium]|nr:MFS transporter [Caldilineaceae bacterium]